MAGAGARRGVGQRDIMLVALPGLEVGVPRLGFCGASSVVGVLRLEAIVAVAGGRSGASVRDVGLLRDASARCHGRLGRPRRVVPSAWRAGGVDPGVFGATPRRRAGRFWPDGLVGHEERWFGTRRSGGSSWAQLRCGATACGASSVFWVLLSRDVMAVWASCAWGCWVTPQRVVLTVWGVLRARWQAGGKTAF